MKTSLSHLPGYKQQQILQITDIIREVVDPEKIILFGSYAMGTWVEDEYMENGIRYSYISDYDFLVVTKENGEKEHIYTDQIINRSRHLTHVAVNCIILDINYINEGLAFGQYFFTDIVNEGISLYDSNKVHFEEPKKLTALEQKKNALRYFDEWFESASGFLKMASSAIDQPKNAVFVLHQATERFYNALLLVFTGYKPKTHSLEKLRQYAKPYSKELLEIFPERSEDNTQSHLFDLLKRGYIDARYKNEYVITSEELTALIDKVRTMQQVVESICKAKITSLG